MKKIWSALRGWPRDYWYATVLVVLALISIGTDVQDLATGVLDITRRIPFFPYPPVLCFFAVVLVKIHKHCARDT